MKIIGLVICLLVMTSGYSQRTYNSTHTIQIPSEITEDIFRTITFSKDNDFILIKSYEDGISIHQQLMVVKSSFEMTRHNGVFQIYDCASPDEIYPTRVIIGSDNPAYIAVIQPSIKTYGGTEIFHLILEVLL